MSENSLKALPIADYLTGLRCGYAGPNRSVSQFTNCSSFKQSACQFSKGKSYIKALCNFLRDDTLPIIMGRPSDQNDKEITDIAEVSNSIWH